MSSLLLKGVFKREGYLKETEDSYANDSDCVSDINVTSITNEQKHSNLPEDSESEVYVTFSVCICLKEGHNLIIQDTSENSNPYVKFKYKNRTYFKSPIIHKNLNPIWDVEFTLLIDDPTTPILMDVFCYNRWATDHYIGGAIIDLSQLKLFQTNTMKLILRDNDWNGNLGDIDVVVTILPLTAHEKNEFLKKASRGIIICEPPKKNSRKVTQAWSSIVNIILVDGRELSIPGHSKDIIPNPLVKFKLGSEKYKSKPVARSCNPKWLEQFDLHMLDKSKHILEMIVIDKKTNMNIGKCNLDLDKLDKDTPNQILCKLDQDNGSLLLLISVTGTSSPHATADLSNFSNEEIRNAAVEKYSWGRTHENFSDIGFLTVKVFRARNLGSVDVANKSNPFVVVELVNALLQTHTEYKTSNPEWNKLFTFTVKDIHSTLEITVYDEDPNKKAEFLGKVAIPLLQIKKSETKWYTLKDQKLQSATKGQILLEMDVIWNPLRAAIRTFNPRERKYMDVKPKFKRRLFMNNYARLKEFLSTMMQISDYVKSCFNWDFPARSTFAFMLFIIFVYFFHIYHLPILILLLFLQPYKYFIRGNIHGKENIEVASGIQEEHNATDMSGQSSDKASVRERIHNLQDTMARVQNTMDYIASLLERIRNTFNFTQPYLSTLAIVVISIITILLYFIPLRWIIMAWGINKFTRKLRNPNFTSTNELLNFLSRVPSDSELITYKEFPIQQQLEDKTFSPIIAEKKTK